MIAVVLKNGVIMIVHSDRLIGRELGIATGKAV